jgi:hypothetical protein
MIPGLPLLDRLAHTDDRTQRSRQGRLGLAVHNLIVLPEIRSGARYAQGSHSGNTDERNIPAKFHRYRHPTPPSACSAHRTDPGPSRDSATQKRGEGRTQARYPHHCIRPARCESLASSTASDTVLFIFQLPGNDPLPEFHAIFPFQPETSPPTGFSRWRSATEITSFGINPVGSRFQRSSTYPSMRYPGSTFPSKNSRLAPPPVLICAICLPNHSGSLHSRCHHHQ